MFKGKMLDVSSGGQGLHRQANRARKEVKPIYRVTRENLVYAMDSRNASVLTVKSGATIIFETCDCFQDQIKSVDTVFDQLDWNRINPATGPVFIEDAKPGDTLAVFIKCIEVGSQGAMVTGPGLGVIGDELTENAIKILPISGGRAVFSEDLCIPLKPMIGVIGTAPAKEAIPCGEPGPHGGNMDCKIITQGATVFLPVEVPGALLSMGDLHAVMGDGEVSVCGVEVSGEVTVSVTVIKGREWKLPVVETEDSFFTIASEKLLDDAAATAARNMVRVLERKGMSKSDAIALMSIAGNLQICQVVDPLKTVRFEMPLRLLHKVSGTGI